jgi:hypothetical protein
VEVKAMPHFVPIPPDKEYWVPKLTELSLFDPNATASIAVWGMPDNSEVKAENNYQFVAEEYRKQGDLRFFYLRGLKAGDRIAAFLPNGGAQFTGWLPIKFVQGDHYAKQRAAGALPRSQHKSNFILDPHGSTQRFPAVPEDVWLRTVDETILKIRGNPIGRQVLGGLVREITIAPFIPSYENANSAVSFTPQSFRGTHPGDRADEILFHELVHVLENNFGGYTDNPTNGLLYSPADFLTVTATNLYSSIEGRPLRKDWAGFLAMPDPYASNAASFKAAYTANFASIKARLPAYLQVFANSSAAWNPFK